MVLGREDEPVIIIRFTVLSSLAEQRRWAIQLGRRRRLLERAKDLVAPRGDTNIPLRIGVKEIPVQG